MKPKILVIDDNENIRKLLEHSLKQDFSLQMAATGNEGLELVRSFRPDLILLDIMLPDISGHDVCGQIKLESDTESIPVVMLTAKKGNVSRTTGYSLGAINYIEKPFCVNELKSIIRSILHHMEKKDKDRFIFGGLEISMGSYSVYKEGKKLSLTTSEFKILSHMARNIDMVCSRRQLLELVSAQNLEITDRTIDNHISHLRKHLKGTPLTIETIYGEGYKIALSQI